MNPSVKTVISASRRTDIPAFYMEWFMEQINRGFFEVVNPYNRKISHVPARPDDVHTIVFWSKNFAPFIKEKYGETLLSMGYNLFFNFTVNSNSPILEPNVLPLPERLDQMDLLCRRFDAARVQWRFDPVCYFKTGNGNVENNLDDFLQIARRAGKAGIKRCITSFMDDYAKIRKRAASIPGFSFIDPPAEKKIEVLLRMENVLYENSIDLSVCCEKKLVDLLPPDSTITNSSCIPNDLFVELSGGNLSLKKDTGQRVQAGCGCRVSKDIGSYHIHKCFHNCLFCYANPVSGKPGHNVATKKLPD